VKNGGWKCRKCYLVLPAGEIRDFTDGSGQLLQSDRGVPGPRSGTKSRENEDRSFSGNGGGVYRYFTKPCFYPNQREAVDAILGALGERKIVLFEGACGTGKTLSALVPALYLAGREGKTVIIATNVHQQMLQFMEEAREIYQKTRIKVAVLKGKTLMCPHPDMDYETCNALRENTYQHMELEKEIGELEASIESLKDRYRRSPDPELREIIETLEQERREKKKTLGDVRVCHLLREVLKSGGGEFQRWLFGGVRSPEEVAAWAYQQGMCGYELLKKELKNVDLLICNYHHILDPEIRCHLLGWLEREPEDVICVFDEAHNLEDAARSHSSVTLSELTIRRGLEEAVQAPGEVRVLFQVLLDTLRETYNERFKFGERERVGDNWYDLRICNPEDRKDVFREKLARKTMEMGIDLEKTIETALKFGGKLDKLYEAEFKKGKSKIRRTPASLKVAGFLQYYLEHGQSMYHYPLLGVRRRDREIQGRIELYTCIPRNVTQPLFESIHSGVLMSATLQPFEAIKTILGIERETLELSYPTTFPQERRRTLAVAVPPLFAKDRDNPQIQQTIKKTLEDIVEATPGNVLIFFPSFQEAKQYHSRLQLDVPVYLDEVGISSSKIREEFFKTGENGGKAVLISYMWGTLTEGIDYKDGRSRAVVIVGVGYPALNDRTRAVEAAYQEAFHHGWDYAILTPTIRKIRQAMGRVIRSPTDYGARILLDARYTTNSPRRMGKYSVFKNFPPQEREEIIDVEPPNIKYALLNFFKDIEQIKKNGK